MPTTEELASCRGQQVVGPSGDKIGKLEEVYVDSATGKPEWFAVSTGLFGTRLSLIPIAGANLRDDTVQVAYDKAKVKDAPNVDPDGDLSQDQEARLYGHYGLAYSEARSDTGLPEGRSGRRPTGRDVSGPTTDEAMTRSEEELHVGTERRERSRARLRKYVVTENVTQTVPVQREEARVEREPITDENIDAAMDGPAISDEEHEVVLHEEEPVVEKRAVPKERVRLEKDTVTDERAVSEDVRKEVIEDDQDRM